LYFSSEALFFWKFFFVFSESEHAQGLMTFSRERPHSSSRPRSSAETVEKGLGRAEATSGAEQRRPLEVSDHSRPSRQQCRQQYCELDRFSEWLINHDHDQTNNWF
jgi:hypothetical protein